MRYVTFDAAGPASVLHVSESEAPHAGSGEVLIAVEAAGISRADVM